jgi:hypothetical protein
MELPIYIDIRDCRKTCDVNFSELKQSVSDIEKMINEIPFPQDTGETPTATLIRIYGNDENFNKLYRLVYINNIVETHLEKDKMNPHMFYSIPMNYEALAEFEIDTETNQFRRLTVLRDVKNPKFSDYSWNQINKI